MEVSMFNWSLFAVIVIVCIPGILITIPVVLKSQTKQMEIASAQGKKIPPMPVMMLVSTVQTIIIAGLAAAAGVILAPKVGLGAPFFKALVSGQPLWPYLQGLIVPTLLVSLGGGLGLVAFYYLIFRPHLDKETVQASENLRMKLGIGARILYGGIVEEVMMRWGLLPLIVWGISLIAGSVTSLVYWIAVVVSGVVFGLGHLPAYLGAGAKRSSILIAMMIILNLWASLMFSYLFLEYGLLAAMISHALFHVVWLPFDLRFAVKKAETVKAD
jgi:hypothetical protein